MINIMRFINLFTCLSALLAYSRSVCPCLASDVFPVFTNTVINITIPASIPGCADDMGHLIGTNYVYQLDGQLFADNKGHIQTVSEGFDGKTDESTPWKTLTELLAFYQNGGSKDNLAALYDETATNYENTMYGTDEMKDRFQAYGRSIVSMQVILSCRYSDNYNLAFIRFDYKDGRHDVMPYFFTLIGTRYKLAAVNLGKPSPWLLNIGLYLNKESGSGIFSK
ncbi:MAG: hypothetical protein ACLPVI_00220 [Dehalococcoidales bacterium]